jgi:outer membrane lipoprotein-sorting protein
MMKKKPYPAALALALAALPFLAQGLWAQAPGAEDILKRVDKNSQFASIRYSAELEVSKGRKTSLKTMESVATADGKALVEFTNPEDFGIKYLKLGDELWMYFPEENDSVKISGNQLKEGMMGSDLSYEDSLDSDALSGKYAATLRSTEEIEGRTAYVVDLKAVAKGTPYDQRSLWVDAQRWVTLKEEMRSRDGTLIKTMRATEVKQVQGRWYVTAFQMKD